MEVIGERIAQLRRDKGMTQKDLADLLGVSGGAVGMWETGNRQPDAKMLLCIADLFEVSLDYIFGRDEKEAPEPAAPVREDEREELLRYYDALDRMDQRWLMGQAVDLLRKSRESAFTQARPPEVLKEAQ